MRIFVVILLCLTLRTVFAQEKQFQNKFIYQFEVGGYFSLTNKLPFWQASNQYGSIPKDLPSFLCRQSIRTKRDTLNKFFKLDYGLEVVTILGKQPQLLLPEAYICTKIGKFQVYAGRKKEIFGIVDTILSSGSLSWSGNALPIPRVQIGIPNYMKLFFNWLSFKGTFSHGWFGNQTYAKDYYLHQKSFFLRIGKPDGMLKLHGGIVHNVQWGGVPKVKLPEGDDRLYNGRFPEDWFVYANVVLPFKKLWGMSPKYEDYNKFELGNRFGNHLGTLDAAAEFTFNKSKLMLYRQFIFEDGQLFGLTNTDDGLYGLSFSPENKSAFKKIVFEYVFTKNQGRYVSGFGRLLGLKDRHPNEENFLFNHQQYLDGWSYNRYTIGTPFLTPEENLRSEKQLDNGYVFVNNNRIWAFYLGLMNQIGSINFTNRVSYSKNFGSYDLIGKPISPVTQISYSVNTVIPLSRLKADLNINIAVDHGDLIRDNFGSYISVIKRW
ncbi:capsule assembly Wzi family protein [Emticicia sp. 17c]|uniref:capsule assembly Wzi family protein n=1 Tax=Emticicia sp. 17c TaxID=3127704 RepID=UPI00301D6474